MLGDNGEHDRNLDSLLDGADGFVLDEGVAHDAEGALMLGIGRDAGRAAAVRHPAADTREHRGTSEASMIASVMVGCGVKG